MLVQFISWVLANLFFLEKIIYYLKEKKTNIILFLSLFSLLVTNTVFSRIAEHGTDRSALILIFVFAIYYLESSKKDIKIIKIILLNIMKK